MAKTIPDDSFQTVSACGEPHTLFCDSKPETWITESIAAIQNGKKLVAGSLSSLENTVEISRLAKTIGSWKYLTVYEQVIARYY